MRDYNKKNEEFNKNERYYIGAYTLISFIVVGILLATEKNGLGLIMIVCIVLINLLFFFQNRRISEQRSFVERQREKIEMAEAVRNTMMSNFSHELRTPLNAICGMSETLMAETRDTKTNEAIYNILVSGRRLEGIVSDVLDYSNLQTGRLQVVDSVYDFSTILNALRNIAINQNRQKKLELIFDFDGRIPSALEGDCDKIQRILSSVVRCCIQYTDKGYVYVGVKTRAESYGVNLVIQIKDSGRSIPEECLGILFSDTRSVADNNWDGTEDTGLGLAIATGFTKMMNGVLHIESKPEGGNLITISIPQKVVDDRPMVELKNRESVRIACYVDGEKYLISDLLSTYVQTYLNMAQSMNFKFTRCQSMTELKYGIDKGWYTHVFMSAEEYKSDKLYFEQISDKVTIVMVQEPEDEQRYGNNIIYLRKPFTILEVASAINGQLKKKQKEQIAPEMKRFVAPDVTVLVVDDNLMNLRVVERLLMKYMLKPEKAQSGAAALEMLKEKQYDLIFMDHMMPEMDGIETFHAIRKMYGDYYKKVPIVALTANAVSGAREMFIQEGFQDYIAKPIDVSQLERVLKKYLPEDKLQSAE